jgi:hypothetical protein
MFPTHITTTITMYLNTSLFAQSCREKWKNGCFFIIFFTESGDFGFHFGHLVQVTGNRL